MKDWQLDGIKLDEAHERSPPVTPALECVLGMVTLGGERWQAWKSSWMKIEETIGNFVGEEKRGSNFCCEMCCWFDL